MLKFNLAQIVRLVRSGFAIVLLCLVAIVVVANTSGFEILDEENLLAIRVGDYVYEMCCYKPVYTSCKDLSELQCTGGTASCTKNKQYKGKCVPATDSCKDAKDYKDYKCEVPAVNPVLRLVDLCELTGDTTNTGCSAGQSRCTYDYTPRGEGVPKTSVLVKGCRDASSKCEQPDPKCDLE